MIIDAHAHISETDYGNAELYLKQIKEAGIDQGVVVPGGMMDVRIMTEYIIGRKNPENLVPNNEYVQKSIKANPDVLRGYFCIDPHEANAANKLEQALRTGYKGLKLSPMTHQFSFSSKAIAELTELCGNYGYPVYTHVVYSPGASTVKFAALAKQFPKTNYILGHMGFGPADQDGLEAARELNNFFLETSTGNFLHIKEAVKKAGPRKIVFGSEFPLSHPAAEIKKILLLDLSDGDKERILGGNISLLLNLSSKEMVSRERVAKEGPVKEKSNQENIKQKGRVWWNGKG